MSTPPDKPNSRRRFLRTSVALVPIASVAGCDLRSSSSATTAGNASAAIFRRNHKESLPPPGESVT